MLTTVYLEGPMGREFGEKWELSVGSPKEALRLIDANKPGVFRWIRSNLDKYERYQVICEYADGTEKALDETEYKISNERPKTMRFVPLIEGAGRGVGQAIVGVILIIVGVIIAYGSWGTLSPYGGYLIGMGVSLLAGGIIQMLSPQPKQFSASEQQESAYEAKGSYYFDGATNTTAQGDPVQLIYGRLVVGSHTVSVSATVDQLM